MREEINDNTAIITIVLQLSEWENKGFFVVVKSEIKYSQFRNSQVMPN